MAVNTWAVPVMRYGKETLKWNADELKNLNKRTRKFTMHRAIYPKINVNGRLRIKF